MVEKLEPIESGNLISNHLALVAHTLMSVGKQMRFDKADLYTPEADQSGKKQGAAPILPEVDHLQEPLKVFCIYQLVL
jgi:hypothetical protein